MKNVLKLTQIYALYLSMFLCMLAFMMGANAPTQSAKEGWALVILIGELIAVYAVASIYINRNK